MRSEPEPIAPDEPFTAADVAAARALLLQSPANSVHLLTGTDLVGLGLLWICWLNRADDLGRLAGNARRPEVIVRAGLAAVATIALAAITHDLYWTLAGITLTLVVVVWWWVKRKAWRTNVALHLVWGAALLGEHERRAGDVPDSKWQELVEKVRRNVGQFAAQASSALSG